MGPGAIDRHPRPRGFDKRQVHARRDEGARGRPVGHGHLVRAGALRQLRKKQEAYHDAGIATMRSMARRAFAATSAGTVMRCFMS